MWGPRIGRRTPPGTAAEHDEGTADEHGEQAAGARLMGNKGGERDRVEPGYGERAGGDADRGDENRRGAI